MQECTERGMSQLRKKKKKGEGEKMVTRWEPGTRRGGDSGAAIALERQLPTVMTSGDSVSSETRTTTPSHSTNTYQGLGKYTPKALGRR